MDHEAGELSGPVIARPAVPPSPEQSMAPERVGCSDCRPKVGIWRGFRRRKVDLDQGRPTDAVAAKMRWREIRGGGEMSCRLEISDMRIFTYATSNVRGSGSAFGDSNTYDYRPNGTAYMSASKEGLAPRRRSLGWAGTHPGPQPRSVGLNRWCEP